MKNKLFTLAEKARKKAYAPYSGHLVGAAIRMKDGSVYTGCNIENSSFGATVCAERVAIAKAVSEGKTELAEVMVVTQATPAWPPCGLCRQVIAEFGSSRTLIHAYNLKKVGETFTFDGLIPRAFTPQHLKRGKKARK